MLHRETGAYMTAYRRPAVYFYVTDFAIMSNWNIVCNTNIHHVDILFNNIYKKNDYGRPVIEKVNYLFVCGSIYNADMGYAKTQNNDKNNNTNM